MGKTAFDGTRQNVFMLAPESLVIIMDKTSPFYDPRVELPLDEDMIAGIMEHGVIEPIIVRKEGENAVVVEGRQRTRSAVEANRRLVKAKRDPITVPCYQRKGTDADLYECSIIANTHRFGDDAVTEAGKMAKCQAGGKSEAQIAAMFRVSVGTVKNRLALLEIAPPVRKLVATGDLSATAAVKLSGLSVDEQCKQAKTLVQSGGTVKDAAEGARKTKRAKAPSSVTPIRRRAEIESQRKAFEGMNERKRAAIDPLDVIRWVVGEEVSF